MASGEAIAGGGGLIIGLLALLNISTRLGEKVSKDACAKCEKGKDDKIEALHEWTLRFEQKFDTSIDKLYDKINTG